MRYVDEYLGRIRAVLDQIDKTQREAVDQAAQLCAAAIAAGRVVHVFGSGHSRIIVEELWPRYGSFPGFHPIVELSLTSYHQVVGANGQRQAMFLENVPGFAAAICANFVITDRDAFIGVSSGGTSVVTVQMAEEMRARGVPVIAITSVEHSRLAGPKAPSGHRLFEVADVVLDTCTPVGDAAVQIEGISAPVGPTSTVAGATLANMLKVRVADLLASAGAEVTPLASTLTVGADQAALSFERAYAEHARRAAGVLAVMPDRA